MRATNENSAGPSPRHQRDGQPEMGPVASLPLDGLRVLDFTQVEFGPSATQVLGDFGADVIKVERPGSGDIIRQVDQLAEAGGERSAYYLSLNRNKRSIAVNFSTPEGQEVLASLAARSDVLVQNFRPGTLERYGLGYEQLSALTPRLIYVTGTGFGEHGPLASKGGQDLLAQSLSGAAMHSRDADGRPWLHPISFADYCSGMVLAQGVLLAVLHRERTGLGQHVRLSLLDTMLAAQLQEYTQWLIRGVEGNFVSQYLVGAFRTIDGWITVAGFFRPNPLQDLCAAFDVPDLSQRPEYADNEARIRNRGKLLEELKPLLRRFTTEECLRRLSERGVLCAPILGYPEVLSHPQVRENGMILELEHPTGSFKTIANPLKMSRAVRRTHQSPPLLGEHTDEVLREAGYSTERIAGLRERDVLGAVPPGHQAGETGQVRQGRRGDGTPRVVMLDLGEVLATPPDLYARLAALVGRDPEAVRAAYWAHRDAYDRGGTAQAFWVGVLAELGLSLAQGTIAELTQVDTAAWTTLRPDAVSLLSSLSAKGVRVGILSNATPEMAQAARQAPWAQHVTDWFFSAELRLAKPDRAIYQHVTSALGLAPERILFIDDRPANVEAALDAGWDARLWITGADTRTLLTGLDLLTPG